MQRVFLVNYFMGNLQGAPNNDQYTEPHSDLPNLFYQQKRGYRLIHVYTMGIVTMSLISISPNPSLNPNVMTPDAVLLAVPEVVVTHPKEVTGLQRPDFLAYFFGHL